MKQLSAIALSLCLLLFAGCQNAEEQDLSVTPESVPPSSVSGSSVSPGVPAPDTQQEEALPDSMDVSAPDESPSQQADAQTGNVPEGVEASLRISVGDSLFTATLADNSSAEALRELLAEGPLTIDMSDYGNFEKVGPLGVTLPTNDEQMTTELGDIILYQGSNLVIYYVPNTWSFTRLGKIDDVTGLMEALGSGDVMVTLSMD